MWSLACTILSILGPREPFFIGLRPEEILRSQATRLGALPDTWHERAAYISRAEYDGDQSRAREAGQTLEAWFETSVQMARRGRAAEVMSREEKDAALSLLRSMLAWTPEERPSVKDVLKSEWMVRWALPAKEQALGLRMGKEA